MSFDFANIGEAIDLVFALNTMMWAVVGVAVGVSVGAMPGLSPAPAIALLLPLTFTMSLPSALGLLIGVYKGGIYGGSISAISFATPGTAEAGATVLDGYKLTEQGKGRKALQMALYASVTADLLTSLLTVFLAPSLALVALKFGPSERLWLIILAITLVGALSGEHFAKGIFAAALGLFIGTIGSDPVSMVPRNTFGQWWLSDGVHLIPLIIGLFAIANMIERIIEIIMARRSRSEKSERIMAQLSKKEEGLTFREYLSAKKEIAIGTGVGAFAGILPGLGATVGAFLSYGVARQLSPEKNLGTGRLEGVAAAEAGNNATAGPTLIPLLAFGIPGGTIAAMLGGALAIQGVQAGPRMFELFPVQVYSLFIILIVANVLVLFFGYTMSGLFAKLGTLKPQMLVPVIMAMALVGAFAYQKSGYDVAMALFFGIMGWLMKLARIPVAPLIITFLLTPLAEQNLRRALLINRGVWNEALFGSWLAIGLAVAAAVLLVLLSRAQLGRRMKGG
ncbi:putative tricarboxylic transport membrane protein [Cohaesibacter sp. ES.047]|uniref:tripartite tricarboxylate transporter permease n=1 Tax=Cohaesibacter sp. ES.047 TaxID=1798205 RepID=UPI000BB7D615|nr:tripartite tricarboxylate transporter permease [Cohaesibacter sp. ES.047]SNY91133.1 putative tricarboxylic transport membrane protein [Cohaesibacter sp. ES.047]